MRIAQVAPMYEAVPPQRYGGTERVIYYLTEELVRRGHDVTLFASGDSHTSARLVPTIETALRERVTLQEMQEMAVPLHLAMLGEVFAQADAFDVVHCHCESLPFAFERFTRTPVVTTLHGRLDGPLWKPVLQRLPNTALVSISDSQRAPLADVNPNWIATVPNSIDVEAFPFRSEPGEYLLFVGRIAPEKCLDSAVEIAKRSGVPLKIAAKVDPVDRAYFEAEIEHLLDHPLVEFIGEVDEMTKRTLMANAYALVFPIDWPEPFGMVLIESLACGTPVLARRRGSVPEILRDGVSACIGETLDDLVAAVPRIATLDRHACRAEAEQRFSTRTVVDGYERVYQELIARRWRDPATALDPNPSAILPVEF